MALVLSNAGKLELLDKMLKDGLSVDEDYTLKLYQNDYTPLAASVIGDFTEADFTGYTSKTLTRSGWNASAIVGGKAEAEYGTTQTWTCGATGNTVYGYTVQGATSGALLWAERFDDTRTLTNGDTENLTVKFTLTTET